MRAECQQPDQRDRGERADRRHCEARPLPRALGCEDQERQHEACRHLDPYADRERSGGRPQPRARARAQQQRKCERRDQDRVVVRAAHREHQQHRVQPDERRRPAPGVPGSAGSSRHHRDGCKGAEDGDRLERPQRSREAKRDERIGEQREQRSVGGVLKGPADEVEDRVGGGFGGDVRVGVEPVQDAQAREGEVAEDVLGDQRWAQQDDHARERDRGAERERPERAGAEQYEQVARAHDQDQRLEASTGETEAEPAQRPRQPRRPASAARGHVLRGARCGACAEEEERHEDAAEPERSECAQRPVGAPRARHPTGTAGTRALTRERAGGYGARGWNQAIVAPRPAGVPCGRYAVSEALLSGIPRGACKPCVHLVARSLSNASQQPHR